MDPKLTSIVVAAVLILILIFVHQQGLVERLTSGDPQAFARLYSSFGQKDLAFEFVPDADTGQGYMKKIMPIDLKSVDINLPKIEGPYNQIRKVEIWSLYGDDPNSSLESDFYNSYLEPDYAFRANPGKYKPVVQVLPGQRVVADMTEPIKKIMFIAIM
jgi:hypothetical protein